MPDESIRLVHASGECEIDFVRRELRVLGTSVPVGGRAFEIIEVLARSAGQLVTKDQLMDRVWPGAIVMESTLHVHAAAIRKALGPNRSLLKTESGRGYRLLGDWSVRRQDAAKPPAGLQRMRIDGESPVTNLPATVTRLVGRTAAVARLRDLISAYRVVTLAGPGGIGKTSLALKVARGIVGEFADGAWFVELASLSDPALLPTVVAEVLKPRPQSDCATPEAVAQAIGNRTMLLVLDNCEHLIGMVASFAETLLALCPHVSIVTTSREILRIQGEFVFRVSPLDVPAIEHIEMAHILEHSAPALFLARSGELGADFSSNSQHLSIIASICRRLDGIPLAIEFAAARAAALGVEQVAAGLHDRFALLTSGRRTALPRHRTLRATLDWSYLLLTEAERELLQRVAIFCGSFSLDAACAIAAEGMSNAEVAETIADLMGKSLVFKAANVMTAEFRLLETTRAYAIDRLTESGAFNQVAALHAQFFLTTPGNFHEREVKPSDDTQAASRHRADEVHAALEWAFSSAGDPAIGLALTIASVPLWFELSQMAVARSRAEQALDHVETGSDQEMRLRMVLGHALWYTTPGSDAIEPTFARALQIAERVGSTEIRTRALWGMWAARRGHGDYTAALELARQYADAARDAGDIGAMHLADRILGLSHHVLGHQPIARGFTERALRQPHLHDPTSGVGYQVETSVAMPAQLARILWLMGLPDQAMAAAKQALAAALTGERSFPIIYVLTFAALPIALWNGDLGEARRQLDLLAAHATGNPRAEQWALCFARVLKLRTGNESDALVALFIKSRIDTAFAPPFADLAPDATIGVPRPGAAPIDLHWNTPEVLRLDALLMLRHDLPGDAEATLLRGKEIARGQNALSWELRCAMSLARLWTKQGRGREARQVLAQIYERFVEGFEAADLRAAKALLDELAP